MDEFSNYQGDEFAQQPQQVLQQGFPVNNRYNSEFTRWQFDTQDILAEIENFLRGRVKNEDDEWKSVYKPLATEEGINLLMGDLKFHLHKGIFLSNLSKDDVQRIAYQTGKMVIQWIYLGWKRFEIDESNFNRIVYNIDHTVFCSLMKPLDDRERKHLSQTTSRNEQILVTSQDQNKKRFGLF
jgi:hypothetical protein